MTSINLKKYERAGYPLIGKEAVSIKNQYKDQILVKLVYPRQK